MELKNKLDTAIILVTHDLGVVGPPGRSRSNYVRRADSGAGTAAEVFYNPSILTPGH